MTLTTEIYLNILYLEKENMVEPRTKIRSFSFAMQCRTSEVTRVCDIRTFLVHCVHVVRSKLIKFFLNSFIHFSYLIGAFTA